MVDFLKGGSVSYYTFGIIIENNYLTLSAADITVLLIWRIQLDQL